MRSAHLTILFFSFLMAQGLYLSAQTADNPNGIAVRAAFPNYLWPLESVDKLDTDHFTGGMEFEYNRFLSQAFDLSFPLRLSKARVALNDQATDLLETSVLGLDAMLNWQISRNTFFRPRLFAGVGAQLEDLKDFVPAFPLGVGLDFKLGSNTYLSSYGSYRVSTTDLRNHLQAGLGLSFQFGSEPKEEKPSDRDNDGVADTMDDCPDTPGVAALKGCPDSDGDSIADKNDDCPTVAGLAAHRGCPDTDGDGIADSKDKCPNQAGPTTNMGCPITDRDNDGIADAEDRCPDMPGTKTANGCPDRDGDGVEDSIDPCPDKAGTFAGCPDSDGDGLADNLDACPNQAGTRENKGCPPIAKEDQEVIDFAIQAVNFETASATLTSDSYAVLDQVADVLKRYPGYHVKIGGHTDSIGSSGDNQSLSEKRAKACYDYLAGKGIAAARMSHAGYGESQPIADNRYAPGREKNRRVEFQLFIP